MCWKFVWFIVLVLSVKLNCEICPEKCDCKKIAQKGSSPDLLKLRCGDSVKISELGEIELANITNEIIQLNLSDNLLTSFTSKFQLKSLQKLDLSKNRIKFLTKRQFSQLSNLRKLDLSQNQITEIDVHAFENLEKLERLKLNQNRISVLLRGTFESLSGLKQLDVSNNPLLCNCDILWFPEWSQRAGVKLLSNPKCEGIPLRKLKTHKCATETSALLQLEPPDDFRQVTFVNDTLKLQCLAPVILDSEQSSILTKIEWSFNGTFLNTSQGFRTREQVLGSRDLMEANIEFEVKREFYGNWSCSYENDTKSVEIHVLTPDTLFCDLNTTVGNRGIYTWPSSVAGNDVTVPCEFLNLSLNVSEQIARHSCSTNGTWSNLDVSKCQFVSEQTRILEQFAGIKTNILESAILFKNYTTTNPKRLFNDYIDLSYSIDTLRNYAELMPVIDVAVQLVDVIDELLELPKVFYEKTEQNIPGVTATLLNVTEVLSGVSMFHKRNLALEQFPVSRDGFTGLKCVWYRDEHVKSDRLFYCVSSQLGEPVEIKGKFVEASVTIPETLFAERIDGNETVTVAFFNNNALFPVSSSREDVTSSVVGVELSGFEGLNGGVSVMLRAPPSDAFEILPYTPVRWDTELNAWSSNGCVFEHSLQDHVVFTCVHFGYYGLLQDVASDERSRQVKNVKVTSHHPAIYAGSFFILVSHFVSVVTYLFGYSSIQIPRKTKHALVNLWTGAFALVYIYAFGVIYTDVVKVCQIVGIALHYFTLSALLWHCVCVNVMYKRLSKNVPNELSNVDELAISEPVRKPILGLYLIGWGIPLIVCGISAAININDYATPSYCFLRRGPPLSAVYIPFALLTAFIAVCTLLVRCAIYNLDANGHLSEGTQATENVDLDLLEPNFNTGSVRSCDSSKTDDSDDIEDPEHAPITQLKAYVISFVLYVVTWILAACATGSFLNNFPEVFTVSYAIVSGLVSSFTVFFHCVARNDVRTLWGSFLKRFRRNRKSIFRSRNIADNSVNAPPPPPLPIQPTAAPSRSSSSCRSSLTKSNNLAPSVELNAKNNLNLLTLHRQQYRVQGGVPNIIENPTSAADAFYNPHQSTVARKFFKRQRKHNVMMMKRTNLNATNASNMFGTNSKVNNTNIHVEYVDKLKEKYSEDERNDRTAYKKKNNVESDSNLMRSVSQQCTLEYDSSENLSVQANETVDGENAGMNDGSARQVANASCAFDFLRKSRSSSVSASDLDELYQQIRRGPPRVRYSCTQERVKLKSPCFSDSEISNKYERCKYEKAPTDDNLSDSVETTV